MFFFAALSLIATAGATYMQYQGQKAQAKAAEQSANYNAKLQQQQAKHEADVAAENARRQGETKRKRIATLRAKAAGSGVSFAGSVMDQLDDTAFTLDREIRDGIYGAKRRAQNLEAGADMTLWEGSQTAAGYNTAASASLLSGAADIGGSAYGFHRQGAFRPTRSQG